MRLEIHTLVQEENKEIPDIQTNNGKEKLSFSLPFAMIDGTFMLA